MVRKYRGSHWFIGDDVIERLKERKVAENRKDSMTAYIQWIVDQYACGAIVNSGEVKAFKVRGSKEQYGQRKAS